MKVKIWLTKLFLLCIFMPYIGLFISLWQNGKEVFAMLLSLAVSAVYVIGEKLLKHTKR